MRIQEIKKKQEKNLMKKKNVNGVMTAYKITNGVKTDKLSIVCLVTKKVSKSEIKDKDIIPKVIDGMSTDVIEVGEVKALGLVESTPLEDKVDRKTKIRPCPMGTSGGHHKITAGTNGELLLIDDDYCIGTNNHVAAMSNDAQLGDAYLQPGPHDGGKNPDDVIGYLYKYEPINFVGIPSDCSVAKVVTGVCNLFAKVLGRKTRLNAVYSNNVVNLVDAAAVLVANDKNVLSKILDIGLPKGSKKASIDMLVQKSGRTTEFTLNGPITAVDATINVSYGAGKTALFENQILISQPGFSAGGDSGSLVLDMDSYAVGKLFAGSDQVTIANHIDDYLNALDAELVTHEVIRV